jgi:hypothetical protein
VSSGAGTIDGAETPVFRSDSYPTTRPGSPDADPFVFATCPSPRTTTCFSDGAASRMGPAFARSASLATMSTLASQSRTMKSHSLGCWASYMGTYAAPSP